MARDKQCNFSLAGTFVFNACDGNAYRQRIFLLMQLLTAMKTARKWNAKHQFWCDFLTQAIRTFLHRKSAFVKRDLQYGFLDS